MEEAAPVEATVEEVVPVAEAAEMRGEDKCIDTPTTSQSNNTPPPEYRNILRQIKR